MKDQLLTKKQRGNPLSLSNLLKLPKVKKSFDKYEKSIINAFFSKYRRISP